MNRTDEGDTCYGWV